MTSTERQVRHDHPRTRMKHVDSIPRSDDAGNFCQTRYLIARQCLSIVALAIVVLFSGCTATEYLSNRAIRENALTSQLNLVGRKGPQISDRTWDTLRRFGLEDLYNANCNKCFNLMHAGFNRLMNSRDRKSQASRKICLISYNLDIIE